VVLKLVFYVLLETSKQDTNCSWEPKEQFLKNLTPDERKGWYMTVYNLQ